MIRSDLDYFVNRALALKGYDNWVFDTSNKLELFKNKLSVEFINWQKSSPIVWRTNIVNVETNECTSLMLEVDSADILVIDRSLISNVGNRKNTRKQKIKTVLEEDFGIPVNLITQHNTSAVTINLFNKAISPNNFYKIDFDLIKSNRRPLYRSGVRILDSKCNKFLNDARATIDVDNLLMNKIIEEEMSIEDEVFFYAFRVNVIFSKQGDFDDEKFFEDLQWAFVSGI